MGGGGTFLLPIPLTGGGIFPFNFGILFSCSTEGEVSMGSLLIYSSFELSMVY